MKALALAGALAAVFSACAPARMIRAEGSAPWRPQDPAYSRAAALADAQRRAALEGGESQISAKTTVDGAVVTHKLTSAASRVRLAEVTVTGERVENGTLHVALRARVAKPGEKGAAPAAPPLRLSVLGEQAGCAEAALLQALRENGILMTASSEAPIARAGVSLEKARPGLAGFLSRRAHLRAGVTAADGSVLAEAAEESAGLGGDAEEAGCAAAARAAGEAGRALAKQLAGA